MDKKGREIVQSRDGESCLRTKTYKRIDWIKFIRSETEMVTSVTEVSSTLLFFIFHVRRINEKNVYHHSDCLCFG